MEKNLFLLSLVLDTLLALRLWRSGLLASYRWLFGYALFLAIRAGVPLALGWSASESAAYRIWWVATEIVVWILLVGIILDLCSTVLQEFPALASWVGRIYKSGLGVAVVLSLTSLFLSPTSGLELSYVAVLSVQRVVLASLLLVVLLLMFALMWLRVPLKQNTIAHASIFFIHFLTKAGIVLIFQTIGYKVLPGVNLGLVITSILCTVAWILFLTPSGETSIVRVGHQWNPEEGERLVRQLSAINRALAERGESNPSHPIGELTK